MSVEYFTVVSYIVARVSWVQGDTATMPSGAGSVLTDDTVPEGHKGLHGFLYGEGGAEVHDGADRTYQSREVCVAI